MEVTKSDLIALKSEMKKYIRTVEIASLEARRLACNSYPFNSRLQQEAEILSKQIEALMEMK